MKRIRTKKKLIAMNMGILMLVSMLVYPIFASNTVDDSVEVVQEDNELIESNQIEEPEEITTPINEQEKEVENNAPIVTNVQPRATVGTEFTANIINNGVENLPCKFEVLTLASNGNPGTVKVANGLYTGFWTSSIDKNNTTGTIAFPDTVSDGTDSYIITEIGNGSFGGCTKITSTGLDNNTTITSVGEQAYDGCTGLQSTGLENNSTVTSLNSTFSGCTGLQSTGLEKNNTVTSTYLAFEGCTGLQSTGLENNRTIKEIDNYTFRNCTGLQSTGLENNRTVTSLKAAFSGCTGLQSTGLENNSTVTSLNSTFSGCTGLQSTGLENNCTVTSLKAAFSGCTRLQSTGLENNNTVTSLEGTFTGCTGLQSTGLENNRTVTSIKDTFTRCTGIQSTGLESNTTVKVVAAKSFEGCIKLSSTGLSENTTVTAIGQMAFRNCTNLVDTGLKRNTTVAEIEQYAFLECSNLDDIVFEITTLPTMKNSVFSSTGVNIYYLPETTNPEVLNDSGAASINKMAITNIAVNSGPTKTTYIEEQEFDPTGLVLDITYDKIGTKQRGYTDSNFSSYFGFDKTEVKLGDKSIEITYGGKSTTQAITVKEKSVIDIKIKTEPTKVKYIEREDFEADGLVLTVYYDNGKSEDITYNDSSKDDFSFDITIVNCRDSEVIITYKGKSISQSIEVETKPIKEIKIKANPNKTEYIEGTRFDPTGMNITVNYEDGDSTIISYNDKTKIDFSFQVISKDRALTNEEMPVLELGNTNVEISYRNEVTTPLAIEVKEKEVTEITVVHKPTKLEYQEGEVFSLEGLILEVAYNNGSKEEVIYDENTKDMFIYNQNELTPKDTKVAVEYQGKKIEIEIKVNDIPEIDVPDSDKTITSSTVDTKDSTIINEFIILLGISLVGIWFIKYRKKVKIV